MLSLASPQCGGTHIEAGAQCEICVVELYSELTDRVL